MFKRQLEQLRWMLLQHPATSWPFQLVLPTPGRQKELPHGISQNCGTHDDMSLSNRWRIHLFPLWVSRGTGQQVDTITIMRTGRTLNHKVAHAVQDFGSSWPCGIFHQCKWYTVAITYFRGWRVAMQDRQAMFANIGTYCLIKHSLRHSPFNLGTVKKASNITMKQEIYQSQYAILHSLWLIPTSWYAMIGSLQTHYFHSIKRSLHTAIWELSWCYQFNWLYDSF